MSITSLIQTRTGSITTLTATSSLTGTVYFYWYLDGAFIGETLDNSKSIALSPGDQARVDVLDSNDPSFDPEANAPTEYPGRRTIVFIRSLDPGVNKYLVEQQAGGSGSWSTIATVPDDAGQWVYQVLTPRLTDLTTYAWRVTAIDAAGNLGTPLALATEFFVRTPDAPDFSISFNSGTLEVTFAAA